MRKSKERDFVLECIYNSKDGYTRAEIKELLERRFGSGSYDEKQITNLLYNLKKANKITKLDNGLFIKKDMGDKKEEFYMDKYIKEVYNYCQMFKKTVDEPGLMEKIEKSRFEFDDVAKLYKVCNNVIRQMNSFKCEEFIKDLQNE